MLEARSTNMGETKIHLQRVFILAGKQSTSHLLGKFYESKGIDFRVKNRAMAFHPGRSVRPGLSISGTQGCKSSKDREFVHSPGGDFMEEAGLKQILRENDDLDRWSLEPMGQEWRKETRIWKLVSGN